MRRCLNVCTSVVVAATLAAACSSGGNDTKADEADFCELVLGAAQGEADFDTSSPEGIQRTLDYYERIQAVAPEEVREDLALVVDGITAFTGSGLDPQSAGSYQEITDALNRFNDFVAAECLADATPDVAPTEAPPAPESSGTGGG